MSTDILQDSSSVFTPSQPSASQPSTPNPRANSKTSYYPSTSSFTSYTSTERKKKKSWMSSAISPNYKSRCNEVRKNFPELPANEMLIGDYSCALQKDILVHGRIYITTNYLCFYANIFRWETAVSIPWKEVTAMTKEKTALVIPNAVQICTGSDKYFFTSFAARDKTHVVMFRLWQNSLLDSPALQPELWKWVQSVYGDKTERYGSEINYNGDESNDAASNCSFEGLEMSLSARPRHHSNIVEEEERDARDKVDGEVKSGDKRSQDSQSDNSDSTRLSDRGNDQSPTIVTDILTYQVWRQSKNAREIISRNFELNIDDLFTLLFTNSKFFYDFQAERKTFDIVQFPWKHSNQSEDKYREVSYTLNLNHAIGPKISRATETQTMRQNSVPGKIYNVDVETTNADIPYADTFYVLTHYCIVKVSETESFLTVLCDIKYKKSPWGLVKTFIEKNCWAGIDEHYTALTEALEREIDNRLVEEEKEGIGNKKIKTRRQRNQRRASASDLSNFNKSGAGPVITQHPTQFTSTPTSTGNYYRNDVSTNLSHRLASHRNEHNLLNVLLLLLGFLCILNVFLVIKMWSLENKISDHSESLLSYPILKAESPKSTNEWLDILQKQEVLHNQELISWRTAVDAALKLLQQTERSMMGVADTFTVDTGGQIIRNLLKVDADTYKKAVLKHVIDQDL